MVDFLVSLDASPGPFLWIADTAYTARLLAGGAPPWLDVAAMIAWRQQAQALLRSSVVLLDAGVIVEAWLADRAALRQMAFAKRGAAGALGALLADGGLRQHVSAVAQGLRRSFAAHPLALVVPSPLAWVSRLGSAMGNGGGQPDEEEVEDGAVEIADFLRTFGSDGIDVLALVEDPAAAAWGPDLYELYDPVINGARHYRWAIGIDMTNVPEPATLEPPVDFVIADADGPGCRGMDVSTALWSGKDPAAAPANGFRYLKIPADGTPEDVLTQLAKLRS